MPLISVSDELISDQSLVEEAGEAVAAVRMVVATVLLAPGESIWLAVLGDPAIPQPGESYSNSHLDLRVVRRTLTTISTDGQQAKIKTQIDYELFRTVSFPLRGGATVSQDKTNKDRNGKLILLKYGATTTGAEIQVAFPAQHATRELADFTDDPDSYVSDFIAKVNATPWNGFERNKYSIGINELQLLELINIMPVRIRIASPNVD